MSCIGLSHTSTTDAPHVGEKKEQFVPINTHAGSKENHRNFEKAKQYTFKQKYSKLSLLFFSKLNLLFYSELFV
jgi:hypothetical protein